MGQYDRKEKSQPKHGKASDSGASKAPPRPTRSGVPGWKGPSYTPKKKSPANQAASAAAREPPTLEHAIPLKLEQSMLDVFRATFPASNEFEALKPTLLEVRDALVRGDFATAFGCEEYLEAYTIRWSPSRALGYAQLLAWICAQRMDDPCIEQLVGSTSHQTTAKAVCFGGGAAENVALAGLLRYLQPSKAIDLAAEVSDSLDAMSISAPNLSPPLLNLKLIDAADWTSVLSKLDQGLRTPPILSKYASAAARAANTPILSPGIVERNFTRAEILDHSTEDLRAAIGPTPALLTLMSTLNDLYTSSMSRTTAFLLRLTEAAPKDSLLLVVDTPGAYSEIVAGNATEGQEEKQKYPMSQLLDYALIPNKLMKKPGRKDSDEAEPQSAWRKVLEEASMSYKLDESLKYPGSLENQKFQVHLFRRT